VGCGGAGVGLGLSGSMPRVFCVPALPSLIHISFLVVEAVDTSALLRAGKSVLGTTSSYARTLKIGSIPKCSRRKTYLLLSTESFGGLLLFRVETIEQHPPTPEL